MAKTWDQDGPSTLPETNSNSPWKWMIGRPVSFWEGAMLISGRVDC